jgi:glycogen synthase
MRFGTIPIVTDVGGLGEIVKHGKNGYVLFDHSAASVYYGVVRAWRQIMNNNHREYLRWSKAAMLRDAGFDSAIKGYMNVIQRVLSGELRNPYRG